MSRSFQARVVENTALLQDLFLLRMRPLGHVMYPEPGQFYMVEATRSTDPLLKRPLCVFDAENEEICFLMRVRGKGTRILSGTPAGEIVNVVGPLGVPYPASEKEPLIVAGGIGIASLFPLIKRLAKRTTVIYGARSAGELVFREKIGQYARKLFVATDDGSSGFKGTAVDLFGEVARSRSSVVVYACGPRMMLMEVSAICARSGFECYVSLEENMACGIGSCMGCSVKAKDGYRRVCKKGPVFRAEDIEWESAR